MSEWRGPVSFTLSTKGEMTSWSPGVEAALGYGADEFVGKPFADLYLDDARAAGIPESVLARASATGRASLAGLKLDASGGQRFIVGAVEPHYSAAKKLDGYFVIFAAEIELGRANPASLNGRTVARPDPQLYVEALEGMNEIFYVIDSALRFVYVNARTEERTGRKRTDMVGKHLWEVFPGATDSEALAEQVRAVSLGLPVRYEVYSPAFQSSVLIKAFPRRGGGLALVVRDLDGTQEPGWLAGTELLDDQAYVGAYDSLGVAVFEWRPDTDEWSMSGPVVDLLGLKPGGSVAGLPGLRALMLPNDARLHDLVVEAAVRQQIGWHTEYRILRPRDNKVAWIEEHVYVEEAEAGRRFVGMVWDISVVKAAEERIGPSQSRLRDEVASNRRMREYLNRAMASEDPQLALGQIVEAAVDLFGARRGCIRLLDRDAGTVTIKAQCGFDADYLVTHGVTAVDVEAYEALAVGQVDDGEGRRVTPAQICEEPTKECWAPLFGLGGKMIGALSLQWDEPLLLSERQQFDLTTLAHQAASIAELLRLHERARDLRERVQPQESVSVDELMQAEIRFRRAFEVGLLAAVITTQDEDRFLEVNAGYTQLTGYEAEEVVGRTSAELGMWSSREDQEKLREAFRRSGDFRELELKLRRKDGGVRNILLSGSKIVYQGKQAWLKMFNDVTAHQRSREELMTAIRDVMSDADWFSQSVVERLSEIQGGRGDQRDEEVELSQRERQVLERVAVGMSDVKIAENLNISVKTVRNHLSNAYAKIGVHNRAEAVVWARDRGIVLSV